MVFLVPYDGSPLTRSALRRAREFTTDQEVVAFTVIPKNAEYARAKGWIDATEPFDVEAVERSLADEVHGIAPDATFEADRTESRPPPAKVAKLIRRAAIGRGAEIVFIGSENAGKIVTPVTSVGTSVSADERYDVYIARRRIGDD